MSNEFKADNTPNLGDWVIWDAKYSPCRNGQCHGKVTKVNRLDIQVNWATCAKHDKMSDLTSRVNVRVATPMDIAGGPPTPVAIPPSDAPTGTLGASTGPSAGNGSTPVASDDSDITLYSNQYRNPLNVGDSVKWGTLSNPCQDGQCVGRVTKADKAIVTVIKMDTSVKWDTSCKEHVLYITSNLVEEMHSSRLVMNMDNSDNRWHEGLSALDADMRNIDSARLLVGESAEIPGFHMKLHILAEGMLWGHSVWRVVMTQVTDIDSTYFTVHNTCTVDNNGEADIRTEKSVNYPTVGDAERAFILRCFAREV